MFLGIDIAHFYLNTPMPEPEYIRRHFDIIPEEIIAKYNLQDLVNREGWVYIEIQKGMYGLPQAGILANQLLENTSPPKDITSANTPWVSGPTFSVVLCSALSLTILE